MAAFVRRLRPQVSCRSSSSAVVPVVACMHHVPALIGPRSFASSCLCGGIAAAQPTATTTTPPPQSLAAATATRRHSVAACAAAARQRGSLAPADAAAAQQELPSAAFGQVISAEANFVRVNISHLDHSSSSSSSSSSSTGTTSSSSSSPAATQVQPQTQTPAPPVPQLLCTVRALLKKIGQRVLVGDHVRVHPIDWADGRGVVEAVQPRSSELADPAVANVDHVLLLFGLTHPPFEPAQVSRFLVSLGASGLPVTLALNKADLLPAAEIQARIDQVAAWGYSAVAVSCETGLGLDQLAHRLAGKVSVVAGPSGAGKSSLINALRLGRHKPDAQQSGSSSAAGGAGGGGVQWQYDHQTPQPQPPSLQQQEQEQHGTADFAISGRSLHSSSNGSTSSSSSTSSADGFLAVGDVSRIGRGRHTTRTVTLIELPFGGLMADTPGFNQPTLDRISSAELAGLFPEFVAVQQDAGGCRFADCMHLAEPGCAVNGAELERHEHYVKFLAEIKAREDYDVRVMQLTKQRREGAMKAKTGRGGATRYEARLNSKKHRTTSRRRLKQSTDWGEDDDGGVLEVAEGESEEQQQQQQAQQRR